VSLAFLGSRGPLLTDMPKPNQNRKSGAPSRGVQIVNLHGSPIKGAPRSSLSILEAYKQLSDLSGGAVGSLTTNTSKAAAPIRPRVSGRVAPRAGGDVRSFARTATEGARKPVSKGGRNPVGRRDAAPSKAGVQSEVPTMTATAEFNKSHPFVPKSTEEWDDYSRNQDEIRRAAFSGMPIEQAQFRQSVVTGRPEVESHLANPELTKYDNAWTNYAGLAVGGISEFKDAQMREKSEFLRFSTPAVAKEIAAIMQRPAHWKDYLNPKSEAFREYWRLVGQAQVRSRYEDDPAALAISSGASRSIASIIAADPDIKDASTWGLLGRGALLVGSPSRALAIYTGDLRRPEDISAGEQVGNAVFDVGAQLVTGMAAERMAVTAAEKIGIGGLLGAATRRSGESAIKQGLVQKAKGYALGEGKAAIRSWADNQAYQLVPRIGKASDLSQTNGKSFAQNFGQLTLDDTAGMVRPYDPRVLADPNVSVSEKVQILFQHGMSLYHSRDKAFNLVAKWAKANGADPRVVRDVEVRGESGTRNPEPGKSPNARSGGSKLDRSLARWSKRKATTNSPVESSGTDVSHSGLDSKEVLHPEILRPGHMPTSQSQDVKILIPGEELPQEVRPLETLGGIQYGTFDKAPYHYVKQSQNREYFTVHDLEYFLKHMPDHDNIYMPATMVDRTYSGHYYNPETGAFFRMQGGHDAGLTDSEYGRVAMRNQKPAADRLHRAVRPSHGLTLAYVGAPEANLSSAHSAHATKAEFEAAIRNGRATESELLEFVQTVVSDKHNGSWGGLKDKPQIPASLDHFYQIIGRDAMIMPIRKELVASVFNKRQGILPHYGKLTHLLSSEDLRRVRAGDVVAALYLDPRQRPGSPSSFVVPDHLAYNHALAGIHLGRTRKVNIRELFPEEYEAAKLAVQKDWSRKGLDLSKVQDGDIYSRMRYLLEHRSDRKLTGKTSAELLRRLSYER
jgi:hypothetical protein